MKNSFLHSALEFARTLSESILPLIFWIFLIFGFDVPYIAILTIITAIIHEIGHIAAISYLSGRYVMPNGRMFGFRIKRTESLSYKDECAVLAAGPLANILIFMLTLPFSSLLDGYVCIFGLINLATAISNLIPVEGYDGYGILKQILSAKNMIGGIRTLDRVSFVFSVLATFLSLYLIDKADSGYWIFAVFFVMMISKLGKYERYGVE
jgi:Zn-dependent protease